MRAKLIKCRRWFGVFLGLIHILAVTVMISSKNPLPPPRQCDLGESCNDPWRDHFPGSVVIAERHFDLIKEPLPYQILMIIDLPIAIIGWAIIFILGAISSSLSLQSISYIAAICWLALGTFQWWFAGAYLHKRFARPYT